MLRIATSQPAGTTDARDNGGTVRTLMRQAAVNKIFLRKAQASHWTSPAPAAGVGEGGPGPGFESATYGNFDVWSTLEEWECLLMDRELAALIADGGPDVVSGDDPPLVLLVPPDLAKALADAGGETLGRIAERWLELRSEDGEAIDNEVAHELVGAVAALAANAARTRSSLYCWTC